MLHRSDSTLDRYGDRRQQSSRDLSPPRSAIRSDFVPHYDSYRPSPGHHAVRDFGSFSRTADTYRPQYMDDTWPSSSTGDNVGYQRRSTYYDRADERQGSSISSTPPRVPSSLPKSQHRSSPSRPLAEMEGSPTSPRHFSVANSGHQSLSSSVSQSRGSSIFQQGPDTKSESRSSSRSPKRSRSGISELDAEFALPQLSIQPVQEKAPPRTTNEVPLSSNGSGAPFETSRSPGMVPYILADKQPSSHEAICMNGHINGNSAASQNALEPNASSLLISESVSSSDATPVRGMCTVRIKEVTMLTMHYRIASWSRGSTRGSGLHNYRCSLPLTWRITTKSRSLCDCRVV